MKPKEEESDDEEETTPANNNVARLLKQLQSTGALIRKPKQEFYCYTCKEEYSCWDELEKHILQHVSLPDLILEKLPSDGESETAHSEDDIWSDEEEAKIPQPAVSKTPQKIDISQILNKSGLSIKRPSTDNKQITAANSALSKLSVLGFTIKKSSSPIKQENPEPDVAKNDDLMQKLGKLGGIKLKLKSEGSNSNSFKVINGLKDFKTSDDEEGGSGGEEEQELEKSDEGSDNENNKSEEHDKFDAEQDSDDEQQSNSYRKNSSDDNITEKTSTNKKITFPAKNIQAKLVTPKVEPIKILKSSNISGQQLKVTSIEKPIRPAVKQTPKRGATIQEIPQSSTQRKSIESEVPPRTSAQNTTPAVDTTTSSNNMQNVVVKTETENETTMPPAQPLFGGQIKTERSSPTPNDVLSTPLTAQVKTENDIPPQQAPQTFSNTSVTEPLLSVPKQENTDVTIIEINGDSNDEDDDCCVVSATPAPDIKPIIPKTESPAYPASVSYSSTQVSTSATPVLSTRLTNAGPPPPSTEKQHNFNWNAPDTKPIVDTLEKSADDIFESLLSSPTKKENMFMSDTSEYISLDRLGSQHTCDTCNTRFTDISLLESHIRMTGHSKSLVTPSSMMPYNPSASNSLMSILPVKLAEQVGKLSAMGNNGSGAFTHQQNVMINIQAYPGAGGMMVPSQPYGGYGPGQTPPGYPTGVQTNPMYATSGQSVPGQAYPGQYNMGQQGYGQPYQPSMSKSVYPGNNPFSTAPGSSPYSTPSPLQSMQQAVYGQAPISGMNQSGQQMGAMGPPSQIPSPSHQYAPSSSPGGTMKNSSGIKIQNVQTFGPGQLGTNVSGTSGQMGAPIALGPPGQMSSPGQIRLNNPSAVGPRPRMPGIRAGTRPSIRPGIQVHGQNIRGSKPGAPRMPMKRVAGAPGGPGQKRRNDMLLPGKHDNEDCHVMAMQKQREGLPLIHSVQGAKDKLNLGSQISITKKTVNKEANAMANVLASRGIMVKQKQKSRSPSPERPLPHIPNLGAGVSIKHTSKSSNFSIPEAKVGGGMLSCKICRKMFLNQNSLSVHMNSAHPQSKVPMFKCDECPAAYPKSLQLQHHKRVFHNVSGPNREFGLPVVDFSQEDNLKRLSNLGIYSFIPLANKEQASGCFGIPVISVHNVQNGMTNSLQALGADGLLSLGPLKALPNT